MTDWATAFGFFPPEFIPWTRFTTRELVKYMEQALLDAMGLKYVDPGKVRLE